MEGEEVYSKGDFKRGARRLFRSQLLPDIYILNYDDVVLELERIVPDSLLGKLYFTKHYLVHCTKTTDDLRPRFGSAGSRKAAYKLSWGRSGCHLIPSLIGLCSGGKLTW